MPATVGTNRAASASNQPRDGSVPVAVAGTASLSAVTDLAPRSPRLDGTRQARLIGAGSALVVGVATAAFLSTQEWAGLQFAGGLPLGVFGIPAAAVLGAWLAPRLRTGPKHGLHTALPLALLVVPLTALLTAIAGVIEIAVRGEDLPLLAPFGMALFGLLIIGPAALLVAIPAAVVWAQLTMRLVRSLAP